MNYCSGSHDAEQCRNWELGTRNWEVFNALNPAPSTQCPAPNLPAAAQAGSWSCSLSYEPLKFYELSTTPEYSLDNN